MPHVATCQCGAARIEVDRRPETVGSCDCTWCERTEALLGYSAPEEVRVVAAPTSVYAPHVLNEHHFCGTCSGMMSNYGPKWTEESAEGGGVPEARQYGLNMRMFVEDAVRALPVTETDGRHGW